MGRDATIYCLCFRVVQISVCAKDGCYLVVVFDVVDNVLILYVY